MHFKLIFEAADDTHGRAEFGGPGHRNVRYHDRSGHQFQEIETEEKPK